MTSKTESSEPKFMMISESELKKLIKKEERYSPRDRMDQQYHYGKITALREVMNRNDDKRTD